MAGKAYAVTHREPMTGMEANVDRIVLSGIDHLVGANLLLTLHDRCDTSVLGASTELCRSAPCDLLNTVEVHERLAEESPGWVVHCGPWSSAAWDVPPNEIDIALEVRQVTHLARAAQAVNSRLCVITSDAQFAGPRLFHAEDAERRGTGPLAECARAIEQALVDSDALIVRTHAYGWSPRGDESSFAQRVWRALSEGRDCPVDGDRYATPILVSDLADTLEILWQRGCTGVWHVTGAERTHQRRFAAELAVVFELTGRQVPLVAPVLGVGRRLVDETSLNTQLLRRSLCQPLPMLREGLQRFAEQAQLDWSARLEALVQGAEVHQRAA